MASIESNTPTYAYRQILDGAAAQIGIYKKDQDSIDTAQENLIARMLKILPNLKKASKVLVIGIGAAQAAVTIAEKTRCKVDYFSFSEKAIKETEEAKEEGDLEKHLSVVHGPLTTLPFDYENYDLVWAQDVFLHSDNKDHLFREIARVLKPEGRFIFTEPMKTADFDDDTNLVSFEMISLDRYKKLANNADLERILIKRMPENLKHHYSKVLSEIEVLLNGKKPKNKEALEKSKPQIQQWLQAAEDGQITWGILLFQKRND